MIAHLAVKRGDSHASMGAEFLLGKATMKIWFIFIMKYNETNPLKAMIQ